MTEEIAMPSRRVIEPFVYFPNHASAIAGLGGAHRSPDPNYCFHTHYFEYAPGKVIMHITLRNARSTIGELSIRIHAYRPDNEALGIKMVAAHRENLAGLSGDHVIAVKFAAIPGVHYAAYGFFTEPSDIVASGIDLIAEEFGDDDLENYHDADAPKTILVPRDLEPVAALVTSQAPSLQTPVSQICTQSQLDDLVNWEPWNTAISQSISPVDRWREIFALRVLDRYGLLQRGVHGLLLEPASNALPTLLRDAGCRLTRLQPSEYIENQTISRDVGFADFAICTHSEEWFTCRSASTAFIDALLQRVMAGGFAIVIFDYDPASGDDERLMTKGEISRAAFHLLGHGHSVAQLNFLSGTDRYGSFQSGTSFAMVIQR